MSSAAGGDGAQRIDGRALADLTRRETAERVERLKARGGTVRLDAVLAAAAEDASHVYAHNQGKACEEVGIEYHLHTLPEDTGFDEIAGRVLLLSADADVKAVMVHLPLPDGIDPYGVQRLIDPSKDIEGVNPANIGNIVYGRSSLAPCTALAVLAMIESTGVALRGRTCVVVGASNIVGKPIAVLLMRHEATVVSCNKYTNGLADFTREADVLVSAVGKPGLITAEMVKPGAVVIDVGTTRVRDAEGRGRTIGDVDFDGVRDVAGWLSPVPGGVGPMTVSMLLRNVVEAAERTFG